MKTIIINNKKNQQQQQQKNPSMLWKTHNMLHNTLYASGQVASFLPDIPVL